ncbi:hypothetical protein JCM21900_001109 [Sporobolomyces salmonicolor]
MDPSASRLLGRDDAASTAAASCSLGPAIFEGTYSYRSWPSSPAAAESLTASGSQESALEAGWGAGEALSFDSEQEEEDKQEAMMMSEEDEDSLPAGDGQSEASDGISLLSWDAISDCDASPPPLPQLQFAETSPSGSPPLPLDSQPSRDQKLHPSVNERVRVTNEHSKAPTSQPSLRPSNEPVNDDESAAQSPSLKRKLSFVLSPSFGTSAQQNDQLASLSPATCSRLVDADPNIDPELLSISLPTPSALPTPSGRSRTPNQAEMDAFFGFVFHPDAAQRQSGPQLSLVQGTSSSAEDQGSSTDKKDQRCGGKGKLQERPRGSRATVQLDLDPADEPSTPEVAPARVRQVVTDGKPLYYQLQPVPSESPQTGLPLTVEEKRLSIITALERFALSVLAQIVDNIVPPAKSAPESQHDFEKENDEPAAETEDPKNRSQSTPKAKKSSGWKPIKVVLAKRGGRPSQPAADDSQESSKKQQTITFPRKLGQEGNIRLGARELACLLKVAATVLDGLKSRIVSTKRDIYYRDVALFVKQQTVDSIVEDLAATLQVRRSDLNIIAASKGLFSGALKIFMADETELAGSSQGTLIPPDQAIEHIENEDLNWVLVVEKEAVFRTLISAGLTSNEELGHGVVLTGKGYPDLATRELVKRLADDLPSIPLLFLVDSDPHGLEILSTYVLGSSSLSHDAANLAIGPGRANWVGIKPSEWDSMGVKREELLLMSAADRKKAGAMVRREWWPAEWRKELEYMLHLSRKAEIEALSSSPSLRPSHQTFSLDAAARDCDDDANSAMMSNASRLFDLVVEKIGAALVAAEIQGDE